jgi:hypothetical protein
VKSGLEKSKKLYFLKGGFPMTFLKGISTMIVISLMLMVFSAANVLAWQQCYWARIPNSHQAGADWCPTGWVITALDLDGCGYGDQHAMGDCPIIAQAKCCMPKLQIASETNREQNQQSLIADTVQGKVVVAGDILFKKDQQNLWRMFEDEKGLYVENIKTGKKYKLALQEMESE